MQNTPFHGKPSWAPPEHADGEEAPSFMACIHENCPTDVSKLDRETGGSLRSQIQGGYRGGRTPPKGGIALSLGLREELRTRTMSL